MCCVRVCFHVFHLLTALSIYQGLFYLLGTAWIFCLLDAGLLTSPCAGAPPPWLASSIYIAMSSIHISYQITIVGESKTVRYRS
jgi:hypothetical protein